MAKRLKRTVGAVAVLAVAAAAGFWYVAAGKSVAQVAAQIEAFNSRARSDGSTAKISYERLERAMFPAIGVHVVNAALELNQPGDGASVPPMVLSWKANGSIDLVTNYLSHGYQLDTKGSSRLELQAGEEKISAQSEPNETHLSIAAKDAAGFQFWQTLNPNDQKAVKAALLNIARFDYDFGPLLIKDATTGNTILSQEKGMIRLANRSAGTQITFDLKADIAGTQITKEYNDIVNRAIIAGRVPVAAIDANEVPFSMVRAGKQDFKIDLSVDTPPPANGPMSNALIDVRELLVKNDFYSLKLPTKILLNEKEGKRNALVKLNWTAEMTPAGGSETALLVKTGSGRVPMLSGDGKNGQVPEGVQEKMLAAIPNLSTLGPVTFAVDLDGHVPVPSPQAKAPDEAAEEVLTVHSVTFGHARWGLDVKGSMARKRKEGLKLDFTLDCKHCDSLTGDLYTTATQAQELANLYQPGRVSWSLSEATLANINAVLADMGTKDATTGDIVFAITSPKPNEIAINNRPAGEFLMKMMAAITPAAPPEQAPAAGTNGDPQ